MATASVKGMAMGWTVKDMPSLAGKTAIVTGSNSGLGYETALALAGAGAETIVAARSRDKGEAAVARIEAVHPRATARFEPLDLGSLASVSAFAERIAAAHGRLDILVNNAGVMALPERETTEDGFERQIGVNFLGHFALTARLLPLLRAAKDARAVQLSSLAHKRRGGLDFDNLQGERDYSPWQAYSFSKLAMLMFALELDRRSRAGGWGV
ncbi:MAG: SDR family NAD(P)-dependent oxidoreductase, partial [Sphingomonas sp.]